MEGERGQVWRRIGAVIRLGFVVFAVAYTALVIIAFVLPWFLPREIGTRETTARVALANIASVLDTFRMDVGRYPTTDEGLKALVEQPSGAPGWRGPYIHCLGAGPADPWGHPFHYSQPGPDGRPFDLSSYGPDGVPSKDDIHAP